jgi:ATP-dependent helicase/nuclease subunit A
VSDAQLSLFGVPAPTQKPPRAGLSDDPARKRIRADLYTSLLIEAGAGAGKTTEMVQRMVALVRTGTARAGEIAAVTFTRKAAAELRERFQTALERELRAALAGPDVEAAERFDAALREIDRAFLGTIHAFCARLLRERPLDAGLDPAFRETLGSEELRLRRRFWHAHLERLAADGDASLAELRDVGLEPHQLHDLFAELAGQPDVEYVAAAAQRPAARELRAAIESLMDRAASVLPRDEPRDGWDRLQVTLRRLRFHRWILSWKRDARFFDIIAELGTSSFKVVRRRWSQQDEAKEIGAAFEALFAPTGAATELLREWWAYRYPVAVRFARDAADAWERERIRAGTLNFQDLLMFAARLLRESPPARRELSDRYRFLLVDEFQDTDPIQAEVLFLLASDEELHLFADSPGAGGEWRPPFASWRYLTPRPGAIFVVGDPKQSIYRFRRADMQLYQQVKRRFETWADGDGAGAVLELTSNFRSGVAIERFVNETFAQRFPDVDTDVQARFAPMRVQPRTQPVPCEGVFWYELDDPVNSRVQQLAQQDAARLATWIDQRIASGERSAGEFLLLTSTTKWLPLYAAALESRNIPVQVTGAALGGQDRYELEELRLLLRALNDPGDATLVLAVLVGLFFGIDYDELTRHSEKWTTSRTPFSFTAGWPEDDGTSAERALATLHRFWTATRREPADVAVPRIIAELGVLPFAAAGELGGSRAGALLFALDAMRAASLNGDASLAGALAALETALDEGDSEAPLEPGRPDAVRVMNLHKAKGLEAPVVILATPFGDWSPEPNARVIRDETGRAVGFATVTERRGPNQTVTLAQPPDWTAHAAEEQRFEQAEEQRLLYVAATRAAHELVIGCAYNAPSPSRWRSFHPWLQQHAEPLALPQPTWPQREKLELDASQVQGRIADVEHARARHAAASYRAAAVSERKAQIAALAAGVDAADDGAAASAAPPVRGRGTEWGTAVHDALMYAAGGMTADALRAACRSRLVALDRPVRDDGEPSELDELIALIDAVRASELWQRAGRADTRLVEVPFAVAMSAAEYSRIGNGAAVDASNAISEIIEGRIDLAFRDDDGWTIVDYKSDAAGAAVPPLLMQRYRAQLALYAAAWEKLTGERVSHTSLLFTATGEAV